MAEPDLPIPAVSAVLQFDSRSQCEINAERDALRAPEDLAARDMRDEGLPHYGDQPIRYDRYGINCLSSFIMNLLLAAVAQVLLCIEIQREQLSAC